MAGYVQARPGPDRTMSVTAAFANLYRRLTLALCVSAVAMLCVHLDAATAFPSRGVVVPGQSIGSVKLGMSQARVRQLWGADYLVCSICGSQTTWMYEYPGAEPLGAAVKFSPAGKVVAVFTLGSPVGWGVKGVMMGDPVSNVYNLVGDAATSTNCIGYNALTVTIGSTSTSFYSSSGVVYGYALTAPAQSPCQ